MSDSELTSENKLLAEAFLAFLAMAVLAATDIFADIGEGTTRSHVVSESGVLLVGLMGAALVLRRLVLGLRRAEPSNGKRLTSNSRCQSSWRMRSAGGGRPGI
ncbi:MAG: hypothetical protein WCE62_20565 [Polyangiales bacterium]